jgi:hypothetical protein
VRLLARVTNEHLVAGEPLRPRLRLRSRSPRARCVAQVGRRARAPGRAGRGGGDSINGR